MFTTIRAILWVVLFLCAVLIIQKSKCKRRNLCWFVSAVLCTVLVVISGMYPIENLFVHFQSPERAFHYIQSGAIKGTVDGRESCMVVYRNNDGAYSYEMILKTEDGYQLPGDFKTKRVSQKLDRQAALDVYNVRGTQDYYVSGFVNQKDIGNDIAVFDPANEKVDTNVVRIENVDFLCFWLPGFSDGYYLKVNGEKIALSP